MSRRQPPPLPASVNKLRCAVYTRKSTEEGLDREFNTLDARGTPVRHTCCPSARRAGSW
jgi:hypothetical protein